MKLLLSFILIFCLVTFTGCDALLSGSNIEELLIAPQPTLLQREVLAAVNTHTGRQTVLATPRSGDYDGALVIDDGSFSGEEAIIAFYSTSNTATDISAALLHLSENSFTVSSSIQGLGNGVETADFVDLDTSGNPFLLVSYTGSTPGETFLVAYNYNNNSLEPYFAQGYQHFLTADVNGTGIPELIFTLVPTDTEGLRIRIISFESGAPVELYVGTPNTSMTQVHNIVASQSSTGNLIAVDGVNAEGTVLSDLFIYEEGTLTSAISPASSQLLQRSGTLLVSTDIDNDGVVEQPGILPPLSGMYSDDYTLVGYYDMKTDATHPKYVGIVDTKQAFMILLPPHWQTSARFSVRDEGYTVVDINTNENLLAIDLLHLDEPFEQLHVGGATQSTLLLGTKRVYLTTFGNLSDYNNSFLRQGILTLF